jgi:hypothetical protein
VKANVARVQAKTKWPVLKRNFSKQLSNTFNSCLKIATSLSETTQACFPLALVDLHCTHSPFRPPRSRSFHKAYLVPHLRSDTLIIRHDVLKPRDRYEL